MQMIVTFDGLVVVIGGLVAIASLLDGLVGGLLVHWAIVVIGRVGRGLALALCGINIAGVVDVQQPAACSCTYIPSKPVIQ